MDTENLHPEARDLQINPYWFPETPPKPTLSRQRICEDGQENHPCKANWSNPEILFEGDQASWPQSEKFSTRLSKTLPDGADACSAVHSIDTNGGLNNWEDTLISKYKVHGDNGSIYSMLSFDSTDGLTFGSLLALAEAATATAPSANTAMHANGDVTSNSFYSIFNNENEDGRPDHMRPSFDLNSPHRKTDTTTSKAMGPQFAPMTPEQIKGREEKRVSNRPNLEVDERRNQAREERVNEIINGSEAKEHDNDKELACVAATLQLQENHNLDKGGNQGTDLNKTPQQRPRRKKHRPKVVIEGRPKRTRRPATPKPAGPNDTPRAKRKYVRRNGLHKQAATPSVEITSGTIDPQATGRAAKSCRRSLNFDFGGQVKEESSVGMPPLNFISDSCAHKIHTIAQSESTVQLRQGMEVIMEKTKVGIAYDYAHSKNKMSEAYTSTSEKRAPAPSVPLKTDLHDKLTADDPNKCTTGKCHIVFSNETHDKEVSSAQMVNTGVQSAPRSLNDSYCSSSACLTEGKRTRGQKREHSCATDKELHIVNGNRTCYNPLQAYLSTITINECNNNKILEMHLPVIYKKKRTEKGHNSTTSSSSSTVTAVENPVKQTTAYLSVDVNQPMSECNCRISVTQFNASRVAAKLAAVSNVEAKQCTSQFQLAMGHRERLKKKRSKGSTWARNSPSLIGIADNKEVPTPTRKAAASGVLQSAEILPQPPTCMEALVADTQATVATKKRTKRNSPAISEPPNMFNHHQHLTKSMGLPDLIWKGVPSVDAIAERLKHLDINQDQYSLIPYDVRFLQHNVLVLYQRDGTLVPVRKRRPRPKVDLDDETNRVWKLLLEDINSQGIDGTDEEKAKWWEEERRIFHGRADSFIARMHLVQGDRRFSQWKGSVVDSVVGVFLTQNVSDHLSSSAFMSLAARFPIKSKNNNGSSHIEIVGPLVQEPETYISGPEEYNIVWHEKKSSVPTCESSMTLVNVVCSEEKGDGNECPRSTGTRSTDYSDSELLESSKIGLDISYESVENGSATQITGTAASFIADQNEIDDVISPQDSLVPSKSCRETTDATERIRSSLHSISSMELASGSELKSFDGSTSFLELLQKAGTSLLHGVQINNIKSRIQDSNSKLQQISDNENSSAVVLEVSKSTSIAHNLRKTGQEVVELNSNDCGSLLGKTVNANSSKKRVRTGKKTQDAVDWDSLRKLVQANGKERETTNTMDSLDWEAVRCADVDVIADTIKERGMNNVLAERIKEFLNRLVREHGSIDLEWLRDVPPDKAKEYLLSIRGLGLKSVECVRLLTLHHLAFPVDTNVGRIAVRLGWVPLQPLPESLQLHLLELYPVLESIQKYLWPRLCKLDQRTLYELHYQMITFGKVFCTKSKPNCNACPMRGECRHFASAFASARLALPAPEEKSIVGALEIQAAEQNPKRVINQFELSYSQASQNPKMQSDSSNHHAIIEILPTPEPLIEEPATPEPEPEQTHTLENDIEDTFYEDPDEIPMIKLNIEEFTQNLQSYMQQNMELQEGDMSKALIALTPEAASIPMPKLKNVSGLRTEHQVYELPDSHPLLERVDRREPGDPCSYLLAIWTPGETADSNEPPERRCGSQECGKLCDERSCLSCNSIRETNSQTVRGTLLIPCRTAMRGSFPLNGTYFQVNEVFADHESSLNPIEVPRAWIWNLPRRTVYFGTSVTTIFKGVSMEAIQYCFWRGFVCVRGFDQKTRAPRPLMARLHFPASKLTRTKGKGDETMHL